jgi:hypothetical protein
MEARSVERIGSATRDPGTFQPSEGPGNQVSTEEMQGLVWQNAATAKPGPAAY